MTRHGMIGLAIGEKTTFRVLNVYGQVEYCLQWLGKNQSKLRKTQSLRYVILLRSLIFIFEVLPNTIPNKTHLFVLIVVNKIEYNCQYCDLKGMRLITTTNINVVRSPDSGFT